MSDVVKFIELVLHLAQYIVDCEFVASKLIESVHEILDFGVEVLVGFAYLLNFLAFFNVSILLKSVIKISQHTVRILSEFLYVVDNEVHKTRLLFGVLHIVKQKLAHRKRGAEFIWVSTHDSPEDAVFLHLFDLLLLQFHSFLLVVG